MDASYVSVNSFKVLGNLASEFNVGRRVRAQQAGDGITYATVSGVSYAAGYTTVVLDESDLTSNLAEVYYGIIQTGSIGSMPVHTHQGNEGDGGYLPGFDTFIELLDTPSAYEADKYLKTTTTGVEFSEVSISSTLLDLTDTPSAYDDDKFLKSTVTGTEWATVSGAGDSLLQDGSTPLTGDWGYGSNSISGTGDIYCNDIFTSSGTVWIGDLQLTTDGENLVAGGTVVSGIIGPQGPAGTDGADGADGSTTLSGLTDTPSTYDDGKYLKSTTSGTEWAEAATGWVYAGQVTLSGNAAELSASIPSSATEIEVMITGASTDTSNQIPVIQLGHSGGYETSGYLTWVQYASTYNRRTDGFYTHESSSFGTGESMTGIYRFTRWDPSEHFWYGDGMGGEDTSEGAARRTFGSITMTGALDRIRLTTQGGAATFDAGEARVRYRS